MDKIKDIMIKDMLDATKNIEEIGARRRQGIPKPEDEENRLDFEVFRSYRRILERLFHGRSI